MKKLFYDGLEKIVYEFENGTLPLSKKDGMKTDSGDQQQDILNTPGQIDLLEQIKEEQNTIDIKSFNKYFPYKRPDKMLQTLYNSKSKADNYDKVSSIYGSFHYFADNVEEKPTCTNKKEEIKILDIVNKILDFNEQNQLVHGLKILTPNQILNRLLISLAQLNAGHNSEKFKSKIRQLLYSLYRL